MTRFSAKIDSGSTMLTSRKTVNVPSTAIPPTAIGSSAARPRKMKKARMASSGKAMASAKPRSDVACLPVCSPATSPPPSSTSERPFSAAWIFETTVLGSGAARSVATTSEERPSVDTRPASWPGAGAVTAATPGTCAMACAAEVTAGLPGGAETRASTPGLASSPVARWIAASARALAELGALNGFDALSRPMAVEPNTPAITNTSRASSSIRRRWRMASSASARSMSAVPAGLQGARGGRRQEHGAHLGDPLQVGFLAPQAE
jgi:hypothetical protein